MKHNNISIFIPHYGCPNMCSFCNQKSISGKQNSVDILEIDEICSNAFNYINDKSNTEIAFFGGSFTAIDEDYMILLLETVQKYLGENKFKGIRISTRPDCINENILDILKKYQVTSIELGAQSMVDEVLISNDRGHSAEDVEKSALLIKSYGFELGLQMMVGLYKSKIEYEYETMDKIISLKPSTVRIYPTVVLKNTKLETLYLSGEYNLFEFDDVVDLCANMLKNFHENNIKVIRCGIHASDLVSSNSIAGFYHPAFREIVESKIYQNEIDKGIKILLEEKKYIDQIKIFISKNCISKAIGHKKSNTEYFSKYKIRNILFKEDETLELFKCKLEV